MCLVTKRLGPGSDADTRRHTEEVQEQGTVRAGRRKDTGQASALGEEEIRPRNSEKRGQGPGRERGTDEAQHSVRPGTSGDQDWSVEAKAEVITA